MKAGIYAVTLSKGIKVNEDGRTAVGVKLDAEERFWTVSGEPHELNEKQIEFLLARGLHENQKLA